MRQHFMLLILVSTIAGCQWVKPSEGADQVALVKPAHVVACKKLGSTTAKVKDSIGFVERKDAKVTEELITLGKNSALDMGGDTIIAVGEPGDGSQAFDVFDCQ